MTYDVVSIHVGNIGRYSYGRWSCLLSSIVSLGSLETSLHTEIGIEEDAVQAYLPDGGILRTENVQDLGGVQDQVCSFTPRT